MKTFVVVLVAVTLIAGCTAADSVNDFDCGAQTCVLSDGVLTISGTGCMNDFDESGAPWYDIREDIKSVDIKEGVTSIGNNSFCDCTNLVSVTIPYSVISIGKMLLKAAQVFKRFISRLTFRRLVHALFVIAAI